MIYFRRFALAAAVVALSVGNADAQRIQESLDRGTVASMSEGVVSVSWRALSGERDTQFNIYKNGKLLKKVKAGEATFLQDAKGMVTDTYEVRPVVNGKEQPTKPVTPWCDADGGLTIQLDRPAAGITEPFSYSRRGEYGRRQRGGDQPFVQEAPKPQEYTYSPNEVLTGDLDGDGAYELVVLWNPSNAHDNAHEGITGPVYFDAYRLDGTKLWRICLGRNVRAGAHYIQPLLADFDGDGKAELAVRTAPGSTDSTGKYILLNNDDPDADYRILDDTLHMGRVGRILSGPSYLTVFEGLTGKELATVPFKPERDIVPDWGDQHGNRGYRFLACAPCLDGQKPSIVMCRGYYTSTTLTAWDWDGKNLTERWTHLSGTKGEGAYGQGNHNLSVADVDNDGKDEIIYGACAFDDDGSLLYTTRLGHGDAMHLGKLDPDNEHLLVWEVHEERHTYKDLGLGFELHDALTGEILWGGPCEEDNGRGCCADIDARYPGHECWSIGDPNIYSIKGKVIATPEGKRPINFRIYWDGDLLDELYDHEKVLKWDGKEFQTMRHFEGCINNNGTKSTPGIQADLLGDWREELVLTDKEDPSKLHVYTTNIPTQHRIRCLMLDPQYRQSIIWQNVCYNQPPHLSYWLGAGADKAPW